MTTKRRGHGEGAIYPRKDGRWAAALILPSGKRKALYGKTRAEVTTKLRDAMKSLDDGISLDTDRQTVAHYLEKWLSAGVKPSVKSRPTKGTNRSCGSALRPASAVSNCPN